LENNAALSGIHEQPSSILPPKDHASATLQMLPAPDSCSEAQQEFRMRFAVQEDFGLKRLGQLIGVPFAFNSADSFYSLRGFYVTTKGGTALPAQFEVLSRYNSGPSDCQAAIRWAYAWVRAELLSDSRGYLVIRKDRRLPKFKFEKLTVTEKKDTIEINTGPTKFTIHKKRFDGLHRVELRTQSGYQQVAGPRKKGPKPDIITQEQQTKFRLSNSTQVDVEIERSGPLYATIAVKSYFTNSKKRRHYRSTARLSFVAGYAGVFVDHTYYHSETESDAPDGARNRKHSDSVVLQLPLKFKPKWIEARAHKKVHRLTPSADIQLRQHKRSPEELRQIYSITQNDKSHETGYVATSPYLAFIGDEFYALTTLSHFSTRDPQGLAFAKNDNLLNIEFQAEPMFVGGARGIWSKAVIEFGRASDFRPLRGDNAYASITRPLIAAPSMSDLNKADVLPLMPTRSLPSRLSKIDNFVDTFHEETVKYMREFRITGLQIWPDLPRESCHHTNDCDYVSKHYYDGGDNNYWDWSLAELEAFLRTADPAFIHDFALAETFLMAETVSWRPDPKTKHNLNFAGFSPCYGSASGYEGPFLEGLNQRRDRCPGDYSYNRVHKLAYILTADRRFTDFFTQGANSVVNYYSVPVNPRPGQWLELSSSRFTNQMLEQLLNGAEFSRDENSKSNRKFLTHALELFRFMSSHSLIDGHACILAGSGVSDVKLSKKCESDQAWMLSLILDFTTRLHALTSSPEIETWLSKHLQKSLRNYMGVAKGGMPDYSQRDRQWVTTYLCDVDSGGLLDSTCVPDRTVENQARFYNGDDMSYLSSFSFLFWRLRKSRPSICSWLPYNYENALRLLDRSESNAMIWGKLPGKIFADAQKTVGVIEACE